MVNKLIGYLYQSVKFVQLNIHWGRELTNGAIKFKLGGQIIILVPGYNSGVQVRIRILTFTFFVSTFSTLFGKKPILEQGTQYRPGIQKPNKIMRTEQITDVDVLQRISYKLLRQDPKQSTTTKWEMLLLHGNLELRNIKE